MDLKHKQEREPIFVVMPFVDLWDEYTRQAAEDALAQSVPTRLILVSNGSRDEEKMKALEWMAARPQPGRTEIWHYRPALTLSEVWNAALKGVFSGGADRVLVVNNDLRLPGQLLEHLSAAMDETKALFVSAVNVQHPDGKFARGEAAVDADEWVRCKFMKPELTSRGGPDYSCFLISRECWERYPFDSQFTYCNDLSHHRRIMLGGEGDRIFGIAVPYLHFASKTVQAHPELHTIANSHRKLYAEMWGGPVNEEKWNSPYAGAPPRDGACTTTPDLQRHRCGGRHLDGGTPPAPDNQG